MVKKVSKSRLKTTAKPKTVKKPTNGTFSVMGAAYQWERLPNSTKIEFWDENGTLLGEANSIEAAKRSVEQKVL